MFDENIQPILRGEAQFRGDVCTEIGATIMLLLPDHPNALTRDQALKGKGIARIELHPKEGMTIKFQDEEYAAAFSEALKEFATKRLFTYKNIKYKKLIEPKEESIQSSSCDIKGKILLFYGNKNPTITLTFNAAVTISNHKLVMNFIEMACQFANSRPHYQTTREFYCEAQHDGKIKGNLREIGVEICKTPLWIQPKTVFVSPVEKSTTGLFQPLDGHTLNNIQSYFDFETTLSFGRTCRFFAEQTYVKRMESFHLNINKPIVFDSINEVDVGYLKIAVRGNAGVGKSSLIVRYVANIFPDFTFMIGVDFNIKVFKDNNVNANLAIWDTMGQERFRTRDYSCCYYQNMNAVILVFDLTDANVLRNIRRWITEIDRYSARNTIKILVGNKSDLTLQREFDFDEIAEFADSIGYTYIETSAKTGENVDSVFANIVQQHMQLNNALSTDMRNDELKI